MNYKPKTEATSQGGVTPFTLQDIVDAIPNTLNERGAYALWCLTGGFAIWCLRGISNFAESPVDNASPHHSEDAETDDFGYTHDAGYAAAEDDTEIELSLPYQDDFMFNEGGIC
jgi:hypothetical protein